MLPYLPYICGYLISYFTYHIILRSPFYYLVIYLKVIFWVPGMQHVSFEKVSFSEGEYCAARKSQKLSPVVKLAENLSSVSYQFWLYFWMRLTCVFVLLGKTETICVNCISFLYTSASDSKALSMLAGMWDYMHPPTHRLVNFILHSSLTVFVYITETCLYNLGTPLNPTFIS